MPTGMSRCGFLASCAAVDTASNPMKAKNTTPAAPRMPMMPPYGCVTPSCVVYVVAAGMYGVWLAGFMYPQPMMITATTMVTFVMTIRLLTQADSCVPRTSNSDRISRMATAGTFIMPCTAVFDCIVSKGEGLHANGTCSPTNDSTLLKHSLHALATVAAATAYWWIRSQPMIPSTHAPIV